MNVTQEMIENGFKRWQEETVLERDKKVINTLFDNKDENIPLFSGHITNKPIIELLELKLTELGVPPIFSESMTRSTLSSVRCGNSVLPIMPYHKAVSIIAFSVALALKEKDVN